MDVNEELYGLMVVAREQQAAVNAAIEALAAERKEAAAQRNALSKQAGDVTRAAKEASADLQTAASRAARQAVVESIQKTSDAICEGFARSARPVLEQISTLTAAAAETEERLRVLLGWMLVRWVLTVAAGVAGLLVAGWFVGMTSVEWQRHEVKQLTDERNELQTEVAGLHVQADAWAKAGGRARLRKCGDAGRLCVRVDKKTAYGQEGDYFVLSGH